ncbi:MAG: glycosyl hydrolase 43 family protein [Chitinophagaceae bacterium]|nr:MAG: glycosyl hydrolase 43 family protein [Chitinophagaceae bacterium]
MKFNLSFLGCLFYCTVAAQQPAWSPDNGDGTYTNPVIHADYSDPDAIRVGNNFYMIASSFNAAPGLPILQSTDLVNWTLIGYVLQKQFPLEVFSKVQHGNGVWAPSIRYHNNEFYIYYPDPDYGIYLTKAKNILGPWSMPVLMHAGKGLIDPCPLWDANGKAYLVHAYAGSRAGFKSIIVVKEMNAGGDSIIGKPVMVFDGQKTDPTIEGPKFYKRNGYYYIFAPAGGVSTGWQLVLRSKSVYGPYERRVVMDQGRSSINGPHQGAWVNTVNGEDWFLHFQDKDAYGRIVHLQPMVWKNDWPVIGSDPDLDGKGEPVMRYRKPYVVKTTQASVPLSSDEFNAPSMGLQWQWQANEQEGWAFPTPYGIYRMNCMKPATELSNLWMLPNMLLQKFPAESFTATTKLDFQPNLIGDQTGLIVFGLDYAYISVVKRADGNYISFAICKKADKGSAEEELFAQKINSRQLFLRATIAKDAIVQFSFSEDGNKFTNLPGSFIAQPGKWVGAKIGLFAVGAGKTNNSGFANIDWFRILK